MTIFANKKWEASLEVCPVCGGVVLNINMLDKKKFHKIQKTNTLQTSKFGQWFCCSGRIPGLSLNQHSLYVGVVEKSPPPPLTGEQHGKMEPQGVFNVPLYFK